MGCETTKVEPQVYYGLKDHTREEKGWSKTYSHALCKDGIISSPEKSIKTLRDICLNS